jgi:hypothetical protein
VRAHISVGVGAALSCIALAACGGTTKTVTTTVPAAPTTTSAGAKLAPSGRLSTKQVEAAVVAANDAGNFCVDTQGDTSKARTKRDDAAMNKTIFALLDALQQDPKTTYVSPNQKLTGTKYVSMVELGRGVIAACNSAGITAVANDIQQAMP